MKRKISALAAVLLAIGLTACGNNNSQVSADATQNMQIESSVETENTNNTEEAEQTVTSEDASNATDEIVEDTSSEATESSEEDGGTLVVYFSRLRYTKKIAYIKANELGADIEEIKTKERTEGTLGFWWCGRFGMHHWAMDTFPLEKDLSTYDKIIIVTPIWVFNICPPIRDFMRKNKDVLSKKKVEMIYNHFNPWLPRCAIKEAKEYANVISITSKTTMLGHTFK